MDSLKAMTASAAAEFRASSLSEDAVVHVSVRSGSSTQTCEKTHWKAKEQVVVLQVHAPPVTVRGVVTRESWD